jgi:transposase
MGMDGMVQRALQAESLRGDVMRTPDEVAAMERLRALGYGTRRISRELGVARNTVRRYLAAGGWSHCQMPPRASALDGLEAWLVERFHRHAGNADVVRQELVAERGIAVSLRTVERAVSHLRRALAAEARATVRFETPPGRQLQIDFGERRVWIAEEHVRVHLFVATLGYSRKVYVRAFRHERQESWFSGLEGAFAAFGGVPAEVLFDNARALVEHHDAATREVVFNARLHAFARYWGFRPCACAPYRARTKGKDESGVKYVKRNALAGRRFASFAELEAHLESWTREIADEREHGTTGESPRLRFERDEASRLRPCNGRPPFEQARELSRRVSNDCSVEVDTNAYSVPWRLLGERVRVVVAGGVVRVVHGEREVAVHAVRHGRRERATDPAHFAGISGRPQVVQPSELTLQEPVPEASVLLRSLAEYDAAAGGAW